MQIYKAESSEQKNKSKNTRIAICNHRKQVKRDKRAMAKATRRSEKRILNKR